MRPDERERMYQLCAMIEKEQNRERFLELIQELNELLERKEHRLEHGSNAEHGNKFEPGEKS
jgi:hypothetical protein